MAYFTPYIDSTGIHVPTYPDIIEYYVSKAREIFGSDIYLGEDSQDYQLLSIVARATAASFQAAVDSYNARDPDTAFDDVLDGLCSINGIERKPSTYSTVSVVLTGTPYTVINNGVVQSVSGDMWNLPSQVVIGGDGTVMVTATSQDKGAITALPNSINIIVTPTYGWTTVNNPNQASVGQAVETNAQLKARRRIAVSTPANTTLESLSAGIDNLLGVTDFIVLENDSKVTDDRGLPGNSICAVVEGGTTEDIAKTLAKLKNMGVLTYGDITTGVVNEYGSPLNISFFRPEYVPVYITVNITARNGYTSVVGNNIKQAMVNYLGELYIGDSLYNSQLWEAALSVSPDNRPYFSIDPSEGITIGTASDTQSKQDLVPTFKQKFTLDIDNITINLVE